MYYQKVLLKGIIGSMANLNLFQAVKNNDLDRTRILVNTGANILEKDIYGCTTLHWASERGHLEIVKFLVNTCMSNVNTNANTNIHSFQVPFGIRIFMSFRNKLYKTWNELSNRNY